MEKMKVAVVGCGKISPIYLKNMTTLFSNLEVVACCAQHPENAAARAAEFGIVPRTLPQILEDPAIELVVVLTPAPSHYAIIRQALLAGKHVYTEKTMTHQLPLARELTDLAKDRGLFLGAAPDTFLGGAWQTARRALDAGAVGEVTGFHMSLNRCLDRLLCQYPFLRLPAGGICYDMGVYYLTCLVNLLGPIREVCAVAENRKPLRENRVPGTADFGQTYTYANEAQVTAILRTESGITGTLLLNGETIGTNLHRFDLYGTEGILQLPDPNAFGGDVTLIRSKTDRQVLENHLPYQENSRGIGPSELAAAIRAGRPSRVSAQLALHVLDVIECMMESTKTGAFVPVQTTCPRPEAFETAN